ncbi:hypothetical protein AAFF_G00323120 [Aldrovandia affinis]|uniref:Uncharacterized protein n=1 Tax=Aldrovandia affinis TaxID=143900 RepID=A0AAD7SPE6_9TELE|nr:hypothetical protein AAFF_G00323120 [Aldrovandia affinis]
MKGKFGSGITTKTKKKHGKALTLTLTLQYNCWMNLRGLAPASPPAARGSPAPSASLEQQKLELEISLLKKQHALLDQQEALPNKRGLVTNNLHKDKQDGVLELQEEYYSHQLKMLNE